MSVCRRLLKTSTDSACTRSVGRLFHSLMARGRKLFLYLLIVCLDLDVAPIVGSCLTVGGFLNLNLNSLLVKRQIDNPSPGAVTGGN